MPTKVYYDKDGNKLNPRQVRRLVGRRGASSAYILGLTSEAEYRENYDRPQNLAQEELKNTTKITDEQGKEYTGKVVDTPAIKESFVGVREVTPQQQQQNRFNDIQTRAQYNLRKPELKDMSYNEFKARKDNPQQNNDYYTQNYGTETQRRDLFARRQLQTTPEQRYIRAATGANVEYKAVEVKRQNGVYANTISKAQKMPSFFERINEDSRLNRPASQTILRESEYYSDIFSYKSARAKTRAESLLYDTARLPLESAKYLYENPARTFGLLALGAGVASAPSLIGGAFPSLSPAVTNIATGASSILGALYVPFVAKEISETSDKPKYLAQTTTQLSLIKGGSMITQPIYTPVYSDSTTKTRRYSGQNVVNDVTKLKNEIVFESQYNKQTIKMTGTETQRGRINPYASDQILTKSDYNIKGEIINEPKGASKLLRSFFTNKAPKPSVFNVKGSSTGTLDILKTGYVEGLIEARQTTTQGKTKTTNRFYNELFYKAEPNKLGLMQFSGSKSSNLGGSYDFRGEELYKRNILQVGSQEVDFSIMRGSEKGFLIDKFSYSPKARGGFEYSNAKIIKTNNNLGGSNSGRSLTQTKTVTSVKSIPYISQFNPLSILQSKKGSVNLIFSNSQLISLTSGSISDNKVTNPQPQKSEYIKKISSNYIIKAESSFSTNQAPNQSYKAFSTQKTNQAPKSELMNTQRQIQAPKMELMGKQEATTKLNSSLIQEQTLKVITLSKTVTKSKVVTKTALKTTALTKIYNFNKGFSINTPYSPPFMPPLFPPINMSGLEKKSSFTTKRNTFLSSKKQYTPTLYAQFTNLTARQKSILGEKTGLGLRPIII